jgi:hypothetical protein
MIIVRSPEDRSSTRKTKRSLFSTLNEKIVGFDMADQDKSDLEETTRLIIGESLAFRP